MKGLLLKSLDRDTALTEQERHDLLGDAEVSESFLGYNNISAMSAHHRRACALLSRTSLSVDPKGAWTFSAPLHPDDVPSQRRRRGQRECRDERVHNLLEGR